MKKKTAKCPPFVRITWADAAGFGPVEDYEQEGIAAIHKPLLTESCGYLCQSDSVGVTLATDVQLWDANDTHPEPYIVFRGVTMIPRGMILKEICSAKKRVTPKCKEVSGS